eukprot:323882-Pelagomonas_calceolata.AAC.2
MDPTVDTKEDAEQEGRGTEPSTPKRMLSRKAGMSWEPIRGTSRTLTNPSTVLMRYISHIKQSVASSFWPALSATLAYLSRNRNISQTYGFASLAFPRCSRTGSCS